MISYDSYDFYSYDFQVQHVRFELQDPNPNPAQTKLLEDINNTIDEVVDNANLVCQQSETVHKQNTHFIQEQIRAIANKAQLKIHSFMSSIPTLSDNPLKRPATATIPSFANPTHHAQEAAILWHSLYRRRARRVSRQSEDILGRNPITPLTLSRSIILN